MNVTSVTSENSIEYLDLIQGMGQSMFTIERNSQTQGSETSVTSNWSEETERMVAESLKRGGVNS